MRIQPNIVRTQNPLDFYPPASQTPLDRCDEILIPEPPPILLASLIAQLKADKNAGPTQIRQQLLGILSHEHNDSLVYNEDDFNRLKSHFGFFDFTIKNGIKALKQEIIHRIEKAERTDDLENQPILQGEALEKKMMNAAHQNNFSLALWLSKYSMNTEALLERSIQVNRLDIVESLLERGVQLFIIGTHVRTGTEYWRSLVNKIPPGPTRTKATQLLKEQLEDYLIKSLQQSNAKKRPYYIVESLQLLKRSPELTRLEDELVKHELTSEQLLDLSQTLFNDQKGHLTAIRARYWLEGKSAIEHNQPQQAIRSFLNIAERSLALWRLFNTLPPFNNQPPIDTAENCRDLAQLSYEYAAAIYQHEHPNSEELPPEIAAYTQPIELSAENLKKTHQLLSDKKTLWELQSSQNLNSYIQLVMTPLTVNYHTAAALVIQREQDLLELEKALQNDQAETIKNFIGILRPQHLDIALQNHSDNVVEELIQQGVDCTKHLNKPFHPAVIKGLRKRLQDHPTDACFYFTQINPNSFKQAIIKPLEPLQIESRTKLGPTILKQFDKLFKKTELFEFFEERQEPFSCLEIRKYLSKLLFNVEQEISSVVSLPKEAKDKKVFYDKMRLHLQHILKALKDPKISLADKRTALTRLAQGGMSCATRQWHETRTAWQILKNEASQDAYKSPSHQKLTNILKSLKHRILIEIQHLYGLETVHGYAALLKEIGHQVGLAEEDNGYQDPLSQQLPPKEELLMAFFARYTPQRILYELKRCMETGELSTAVISEILSDCTPASAKKGAAQERFYDLISNEEGLLKPESLIMLALLSDVLIPTQNIETDLNQELGLHGEQTPEFMQILATFYPNSTEWKPFLRWQAPQEPTDEPLDEHCNLVAGQVLGKLKLSDIDRAADALMRSQYFYEKTKRSLSLEQAQKLARSIILLDDL